MPFSLHSKSAATQALSGGRMTPHSPGTGMLACPADIPTRVQRNRSGRKTTRTNVRLRLISTSAPPGSGLPGCTSRRCDMMLFVISEEQHADAPRQKRTQADPHIQCEARRVKEQRVPTYTERRLYQRHYTLCLGCLRLTCRSARVPQDRRIDTTIKASGTRRRVRAYPCKFRSGRKKTSVCTVQ